MKVNRFTSVLALTAGLLFVLAGCGGGGGGESAGGGDGSQTVSVGGQFAGYLSQTTVADPGALSSGDPNVVVLNGTMQVVGTLGFSEIFDWSVLLDTVTLVAESTKTIVLFPDTYTFTLVVSRTAQSYEGVVTQAIGEGQTAVNMTITPIIGDTVTDVTTVNELPVFSLNYPEILAAGIATPKLMIVIDEDVVDPVGGASLAQVFNITVNADGTIPDMSMSLAPAGSVHTIRIELLDDTILKGRSDGSPTIVAGTDVTVNLVSIHGEVAISMTEATGAASFDFTIPDVVVDEAGGIADLLATMKVIGTVAHPAGTEVDLASGSIGNHDPAVVTVTKMSQAVVPDGPWTATVSMSEGFQYGDVTISISFSDMEGTPAVFTDDDPLGNCSFVITLVDDDVALLADRAGTCVVNLRRRSVISGDLLAVVGINVWDQANAPVEFAKIIVDGVLEPLLTGSGAFGTKGYLKIFLKADAAPHDSSADDLTNIRAEGVSFFGEEDVHLAPLSVNNVTVVLSNAIGVLGYGIDNGDNSLHLVDVANATSTFIGLMGFGGFSEGIARSPAGELFVTDAAGNLYKIDPTSGASTLIGSTGRGNIEGLDFVGSMLMGVDFNATPTLFSINTTDATTADIRTATEVTGQVRAMTTLNSTTVLIRTDGSNFLRSMDTTTGATALIMDLGDPGFIAVGLDFANDGNLYGLNLDGTVIRIDMGGGTVTAIGDTGNPGWVGLATLP